MHETISDHRIRHLATSASLLYSDFDERLNGHIVEAVMRHLPPDFDRSRVEQIVNQLLS